MTVRNMFSKSVGLRVLSAIATLVSLTLCAPNCNDSDLRSCMEELKVLTNNQDLAFAQTEYELSQTCGHLQDAMMCVNNFTSRCFGDTQRELYQTLTSGAQQLLEDLCTHGSGFRQKYLIHASCYRNLSSEYRKCADNYLSQQETAKKEDMHVKDKLRKSCCLFDGYKECTREAVLRRCSAEAADLGEQIVTKAGGPLVQTHCASFKHNTPDCMFGDTSNFSALPIPSAVLMFIMILVSMKTAYSNR